jgi:hypothetical protein
MMPIPSSEPTNIRSHSTKFCCPMGLVPGTYAPLYYVYKIELEKMGRIAIKHRTNKRFVETIRWKPKIGDRALESKA